MITPTLLNNRYKVLEVLADGGFGETFVAQDTQMPSSRRCVIKQLKPVADNPQVYQLVQQRFQQEAAILEELGDGSSQIPRLYAYFTDNGLFYLVQEYIEGQTLTQKLQQGLLSETEVKEILINILPILDYVHSKGMVHRDIKPDNIILRFSDGKPVLIDFGAVKVTMQTQVAHPGNSNSSIVIGTPGFMPSEQLVGRPVFSSDLYSLGLTAIYLLTGRMPQELDFDSNTGETLWRHYAYNISPGFASVLDKAIRKSPRDRYSSAREMLLALQTPATPIAPTVPVSPQVINPPPPPLQAPTVAIAQPAAYQQRQTGIASWLQGAIIGSAIGACVLGGFWFLRGQTPIQKEPVTTVVPSTSTPIPSEPSSAISRSRQTSIVTKPSNSSTSSSQSKQTSIETKPSNPSTPSSEDRQTSIDTNPSNPSTTSNSDYEEPSKSETTSSPSITNTPGIDFSSSPTPIAADEAQNLINKWLQAKRVMFAPPYDSQLATDLTTGEQYENTAGVVGSINDLKSNGHYYKFGVQKIEGVDEFSVNGNLATIQVKVTEDRKLFDKNGQIIPKETDFKTRTVRYTLQFVDERWKIASTQVIPN